MYVELHCHSCFSLLDGTSTPEALVNHAAELDMPALALTDHDALYGAVSFWRACGQAGIKPIFGAEVTVKCGDGEREGGGGKARGKEGVYSHLTLLAKNGTGYTSLSRLITAARMRCTKGNATATWDDLATHSRGLIALSGCRRGEVAQYLLAGHSELAIKTAHRLRELFGPHNFFVELQQQYRPGDQRLAWQLATLAAKHKFPVVATNNVHYAVRAGHRLHDVMIAIRHLKTLEESHHLRRGNSESFLKSADEMTRLFAERPDAVMRTRDIAGRCNVSLRHGVQDLPRFPVPTQSLLAVSRVQASTPAPDADQQVYLRWLCESAMHGHFGAEPGERVRRMLDHELAVIGRLGLANYFLIVWDIMRFARAQGIRCQGRGSAANSLVAYLLGITPIDPLTHDLVFERFLSEERASLPDIDIDFDALRREEVIQYAYQRYGREHAAMACTLITFRRRSAIRDVGKALGFPSELLDVLAHLLSEANVDAADFPDARLNSHSWQLLLQLCDEIRGLPRHLGIHNGGMVLSGPPLAEIVPLEPATMADRTVCQWDKEALEDAGLVKIDLLGLRMLSALEEACDVVEQITGHRPNLDHLTFDDPAVYDMICRGDTIGCFQVESRAQAQLIPHFQPRCFNDLVVEISLIRPGPIQGNMVQPYLRRRRGAQRSPACDPPHNPGDVTTEGAEPVTYLHPLLEPALGETLGVIVFQEQVLKVARDLAGLTGGQGELLRRALGRKDGEAELEKLRAVFLAGAASKNVPADVAEAVFEQLKAFGGYAFAKSHAASFAVIVYQSAWLKHYHTLAFTIGLLRCQPMGFYSPAVLINDAKRHGIRVLPVNVNHSGVRYEAEGDAIRIGLSTVKGLGETGAERVVLARSTPFASASELARAVALPGGARHSDSGKPGRARSASLPGAGARGHPHTPGLFETGPSDGNQSAGRFTSLADFCRRTRLPRLLVERLIMAGALDSLLVDNRQSSIVNHQLAPRRRELLWQLGLLDYEEDTLLLDQAEVQVEADGIPEELPALRPLEALAEELRVTGVSAGEHVMAHHRPKLAEQGVLSSRDLATCLGGETVWVAGQVTVIQSPPTAKGFWFLTLEDEFGMINVIIRPDVAARYRRVWRASPLLAVQGRVQREGSAINVLARQPWRLGQSP